MAVQCKLRGYLNPEDRKMLAELAGRFKATAVLVCKKKGRWGLESLTRPAGDAAPANKRR